jgi:hypothetical protein
MTVQDAFDDHFLALRCTAPVSTDTLRSNVLKP